MMANLQPIVAFLKRTYPLPSLDPVGLPSQSWEAWHNAYYLVLEVGS